MSFASPVLTTYKHEVLPLITRHLSLVFSTHETFAIDQRAVCTSALKIMEKVPSQCMDDTMAATRRTYIRVLIGICDFLFASENPLVTPTLSDHILTILFDGFSQVGSLASCI